MLWEGRWGTGMDKSEKLKRWNLILILPLCQEHWGERWYSRPRTTHRLVSWHPEKEDTIGQQWMLPKSQRSIRSVYLTSCERPLDIGFLVLSRARQALDSQVSQSPEFQVPLRYLSVSMYSLHSVFVTRKMKTTTAGLF
jgi:hypothetical protein